MAKIHRNDDSYATRRMQPVVPPEPKSEPVPDQETEPRRTERPHAANPRGESNRPTEAQHPTEHKSHTKSGKTAKKHNKTNIAYNVAMVVCLVVFLVSAGLLVKRYFDDRKTESEFANLQSMIDSDAQTAEDGEEPNSAKFAALREQNSCLLYTSDAADE